MRDGQLTLFGRPVWVEAVPPLVGDGLQVGDLWVDLFAVVAKRCTSITPVTFVSIENNGGGTVNSVATGTGLTGGPITTSGTISLADTTVTPGSYTYSAITVDQQGRLTAASSGTSPVVSVSGTATHISSTGGTTPVINLIDTAVTPASYTNTSLTVDQKGRITAASSGTAPVTSVSGTTNRITITGSVTPTVDISASYVGQSSITTLGTITTGTWNGSLLTGTYGGTGVNNGSFTATLTGNCSLVGTNTGDQTITLTSDVTGSGTGSFATTIANKAVTLTKMADMATASFLGRNTAGTGVPEVLSEATAKTMLNLSGTNSGDQTITLTGDVTGSGTGSFATTLANTAVTAASYTYTSLTVDAKGRLTAASSGTAPVTSVTGTTNRITSSGGTTPAIDISASYVGQSSITTLGTITTGTWNGTTVAVANGGSGRTSTTAYAVICGGTTTTGAEQSIASVGTSGQVLTSNGASALPTFQAAATGSQSYPAGGRLTLASATPVTTTDQTAKTTVYYAEYTGDQIALYDGSSTWNTISFTNISVAVPASTSTMYDVFCYNNSGTATLETLAWTNDTTRATALVLQNGIYVKSGATTRRYLGSIRTTGTSGQCEDSIAKRYVWNMYNRINRAMRTNETTATWTYTTAVWRQARASTANQLDFIRGLDIDAVAAHVSVVVANPSTGLAFAVSIGLDSTTTPSSDTIYQASTQFDANTGEPVCGYYTGLPGLGRHTLVWLETAQAGGTFTWVCVQSVAGAQVQSGLVGSMLA